MGKNKIETALLEIRQDYADLEEDKVLCSISFTVQTLSDFQYRLYETITMRSYWLGFIFGRVQRRCQCYIYYRHAVLPIVMRRDLLNLWMVCCCV